MIILFVIIGLSLLVLVHELGHFLTAKWFGVGVEEFGFGFPPRLIGKKIGETVYSVNLLPFGGFVKITGEDGDARAGADGKNFSLQPIWKRSCIVLAGITMNVVFGWLVFSGIFMAGSPEHLLVTNVVSASPAALGGIKSGDVIFQIAYGEEKLHDPIQSDDFVALVKKSAGKETQLTIQRGKEMFPIVLTGRINPPSGEGALGIALTEIGFPKEPFFSSLVKGFERTMGTTTLIINGFWNLFSQIFVTPAALESLTGPVGIFKIAADAGSLGSVYLFELIALISLNLAVLNFIPFPALDGGRFLFFIIEKIKGSPLTLRLQTIVNAAGFVILILLMIVVTIRDVARIIAL